MDLIVGLQKARNPTYPLLDSGFGQQGHEPKNFSVFTLSAF